MITNITNILLNLEPAPNIAPVPTVIFNTILFVIVIGFVIWYFKKINHE